MQNNEVTLRIMRILGCFFRPAKRICRTLAGLEKIVHAKIGEL